MITNIDRIRAAADIVDVVGRRVALRKQGAAFHGVCPFHGGSGRSFTVQPEKGLWYCFGVCREGGDALDFVMRFERLEFREAAELLAAEVGVIPEYDAAPDRAGGPTRQQLFSAVEAACAWYEARLVDERNGRAVDYLDGRGLGAEICGRWRIGYAQGNSVTECGADVDHLVAAGVLHRSGDGTRVFDPLAGRVVLPILDVTGRPVAFVGRLLDSAPDRPKYLNTGDTPIFKKGGALFGYWQASRMVRAAGAGQAVYLIEGQIKALALCESGLPAVAAGGTAFSERQATLVQRLSDLAVICPDPDAAGTAAAIRIAQALRAVEVEVGVGTLRLPDTLEAPVKDPDDLLPLGLRPEYDVENFLPWLYRAVIGAGPVTSVAAATLVNDKLLPLILEHPLPTVRAVELGMLAGLSGIAAEALVPGKVKDARLPASARPAVPAAAPVSEAMTPGRLLCSVLLQMPTGDDPLWWSRHLHWVDLPEEMLTTVAVIARCKRQAVRRGISLAAVISECVSAPLAQRLLGWLTYKLPMPPDLGALEAVQGRLVEEERRRRRLAQVAGVPAGPAVAEGGVVA